MIHIDGSFGEGGGQILRTSLALAAITGKDVTIEKIRANREKPGLRPQHLTGVIALADICGAEVRGIDVGSTELVFRPHAINPGNYYFDISHIRSSAGSVNLVLQAILWPLAFAGKKSRVTIKGGTHVPMAPTSNYISEVFLPTVAEMGLICSYEVVTCGYYPIGGGEVRIEIRPVDSINPIHLTERTEPVSIELTSAVSNLPPSIAERQLNTGIERVKQMRSAGNGSTAPSYSAEMKGYPSPGKGTLFFALARSGRIKAGFQSLGELRKRAEKVASDACDELEQYMSCPMALDKHLADQLIIPMALAQGSSSFTTCEITQHLVTNIAIVQKFLDAGFHISHGIGEPGMVRKL